ncbi:MAG TPA: hypothetical protein VN667_19545, partial [Burkholderiales bacterium]|nr:hypothetical protein [Burkholderiales bacterium]
MTKEQQFAPFFLDGKARLKHINLRKEGEEDNKELASDLKFEATTGADLLLAFHPQLRLMLFNPDGEVRFPMMGAVSWAGQFNSMAVRISPNEPGERRFNSAKLKSFVFEPQRGFKVKVTLSAQIHPQAGDPDFLAECLHEDVPIQIEAMGDLFSAESRQDPAEHARQMHNRAMQDGTTVRIKVGDAEVTLGALNDDILAKFRAAGKAEGEKEDGGDFDKGYAMVCAAFAQVFIEEHATELEAVYADGYDE